MSELNQFFLNFNQKQNFNYNDYYVSKVIILFLN